MLLAAGTSRALGKQKVQHADMYCLRRASIAHGGTEPEVNQRNEANNIECCCKIVHFHCGRCCCQKARPLQLSVYAM
jgi:hypothetical protein